MKIHGMVRIEDKCVVVECAKGRWKPLDPAVSSGRARIDADTIREAILYAVEQHVAEEATSGGCRVTFPFKIDQKVRIKTSGEIRVVKQLIVRENGDLSIDCYGPDGVEYTGSWDPGNLEAIPPTSIDKLKELRSRIAGHGVAPGVVGEFEAIIAELETELNDAS